MKPLGQHFLVNRATVRTIIKHLDPQPGETIIEIGPGTGVLTIPLAEVCAQVNAKFIAIEKDKQLAEKLVNSINSNWKLEVMIGDALKIIPKLITDNRLPITNYKLVGNIPYYITGRLLRVISEIEPKPTHALLTIQEEVAQRITAKEPHMNLLSAITHAWAETHILARLKAEDFDPPPKVRSAIIELTARREPLTPHFASYVRLMKILFKQPRKTAFNNLRAGLRAPEKTLETCLREIGIHPAARPQELSLLMLVNLAASLETKCD